MNKQGNNFLVWASIACLTLIIPIGLIFQFHFRLPMDDAWDDNILGYFAYINHTLTWHSWFAFHNEHRMVLTRLVYALNYCLFPRSVSFTNYVSYSLIFLTYTLLIRLVKATSNQDQVQKNNNAPWFYLLIALFLFTPCNFRYYSWPDTIGFTLLELFAIASIYCANKTGMGWRQIALCALLSILTTLSSANGLVIWFIIFAQLYLMRTTRTKLISYSIIGISTIALYLHGSQPEHLTLNQPLQSLLYFFSFLGNPTSFHHGTVIPMAVGAVVCSLYIHCLTLIVKHTTKQQRLAFYPWLACMAFSLSNALVASINHIQFGRNQALSLRYVLLSAIGLIALSACYRLLKSHLSKPCYRTLIIFMWVYIILIVSSFIHLGSSIVTSNYKYRPDEIALAYKIFLPGGHGIYSPGNYHISDRVLPFYQSNIYPLTKPQPNYLLKTIPPTTMRSIGTPMNTKNIHLIIGKMPNPAKILSGMQLGQTVTGSIQAQSIKQRSQLSGSILFLNEDNRVIGVAFTGIPLFKPSNPALKLFGFQLAGEHISKTIWLFKNNAIKQNVTPLPN